MEGVRHDEAFTAPLLELAEFDTIQKTKYREPGMIQIAGSTGSQKGHLAYALAREDRRVLYVTLEDYSGLASMTGEEYKSDFSDILYYFSQGNLNFMRLSGIVHSIGNMDYIPPARYPEDLAHIPAEQMAELIRKLAADCGYEIIILDVGNYGHQLRRFSPSARSCICR